MPCLKPASHTIVRPTEQPLKLLIMIQHNHTQDDTSWSEQVAILRPVSDASDYWPDATDTGRKNDICSDKEICLGNDFKTDLAIVRLTQETANHKANWDCLRWKSNEKSNYDRIWAMLRRGSKTHKNFICNPAPSSLRCCEMQA